MAKAIMIQGTCSNAGKSLVTAGICRILKNRGYKVCPFKSQNMALNSFITDDGLEMGRAQVMQAEAAGLKPDCRMNPILLKPTSDSGSQVIVGGEVVGNISARDYYKEKKNFKGKVLEAYNSLAKDFDVMVIEGAGSPAEINLAEDDIVNMGMAEMADAKVLLVGDIDRGGVFASLAGTMLLFKPEERKRVKGVIINKFRGDVTILEPGLEMLEDIIKVPVAGVIPYMDVDIDDEDSLTDRFSRKRADSLVDICVVRTPRISNFTDFNALECIDGVGVRYITKPDELGNPDLIILPGTKNTMGDLKWLRESGMEAAIIKAKNRGTVIFGICGGFQMLGMELSDPLNIEEGGCLKGLGLLPHSTVFEDNKIRKSEIGVLSEVDGIFTKLSGLTYKGYEIHMGISGADGNLICKDNVYGTYIHGIFDKEEIAKTVVGALMEYKGIDSSSIKAFDMESYKEEQYNKLAEYMEKSLDVDFILSLID